MAGLDPAIHEQNQRPGAIPAFFPFDIDAFALLSSSANGSRECAPDDRLRRTIQYAAASRLYR
jgi:hypothetical protein